MVELLHSVYIRACDGDTCSNDLFDRIEKQERMAHKILRCIWEKPAFYFYAERYTAEAVRPYKNF